MAEAQSGSSVPSTDSLCVTTSKCQGSMTRSAAEGPRRPSRNWPAGLHRHHELVKHHVPTPGQFAPRDGRLVVTYSAIGKRVGCLVADEVDTVPFLDCAECPSRPAYRSWNSIMIVGTEAAAKQPPAPLLTYLPLPAGPLSRNRSHVFTPPNCDLYLASPGQRRCEGLSWRTASPPLSLAGPFSPESLHRE